MSSLWPGSSAPAGGGAVHAAILASNAENAMDAGALLDDLRGGRAESHKAGLKPVTN
jgi:hypothetical protein